MMNNQSTNKKSLSMIDYLESLKELAKIKNMVENEVKQICQEEVKFAIEKAKQEEENKYLKKLIEIKQETTQNSNQECREQISNLFQTIIGKVGNSIYMEQGTVMTEPTTSITSNITDSPGAVANVAKYLRGVKTEVTQNVSKSESSDEVKDLMNELKELITSLDPSINPEKTKELASDLETLSGEMAKPEPRRKWYELSIEGIKEAAKVLGDVGVPILNTVKKLAPLLLS